jgi:sugar lactone lactonase YvrE
MPWPAVGLATAAAPEGVALDHAGNLLISDTLNSRVRAVAARTGTFYGQPMTAGHIYTVAGTGVPSFSGDGGPAVDAGVVSPDGLTVDTAGNLLIADGGSARVRVVAARTGTFYGQNMTAGDIYTAAGNGPADFCCDRAPAASAEMNTPVAAITDHAGNVVIADASDNRIRVVAARTGTFYGQDMTAGHIYTVAGSGKHGLAPDGIPATKAALHTPDGVQVDRAGNLVLADFRDNRIRVVAVTAGTFYGVAMKAGDIYTVAGSGSGQFSGDGGPAAGAGIPRPAGVALDSAGNLLIADKDASRIRVVAATTGSFYGQAMTADDIYTVAGDGVAGFSGDNGPATQAELQFPTGVVADRAGNLVIADAFNSRIRVVAVRTGGFYGRQMTAGDIYTIAGNGRFGFAGDGGPAGGAEFSMPLGVAVDGAGNLVVADAQLVPRPRLAGNNRVRVIAATTGLFYGVPMRAGDIYTVGGNGGLGLSGDGGPATRAELDDPVGVGIGPAGGLLVADAHDGRLREIAR